MATVGRKRFLLYGSNVLGWRLVRRVSFDEGLEAESRGLWRRVHDGISNELLGWQLIEAEVVRGDEDIPTRESAAAIPAAEMAMNAGCSGRSATARLTEEQRLARKHPEDAIERVQKKVIVWPNVGAAKGDILRAWPRASHGS